MTISLKHTFNSAKSDGSDATLVQPSNWNAEHTITMATAKILGRATAGTGAVEELSVTGTGAVVLADSPVLTTQLTAPLLIGGTAAGSTLTLLSTSGTGTSDAIIFKGGSAQRERMRVNGPDGLVEIGQSGTAGGGLAIYGGTFAQSRVQITRYGNTAGSADTNMQFNVSRGAMGVQTANATGDFIAEFGFNASDGTAFREAANLVISVNGAVASNSVPGAFSFRTNSVGASAAVERVTIDSTGLATFKFGAAFDSPTVPFGYVAGAGGTVTQLTSKATGVTLNKVTGKVTTHNAALAANTAVSFVMQNSTIGADDVVCASVKLGTANSGSYTLTTSRTGGGNCTFVLTNNSAGSLSDAVDISFVVLKGAVA